MIAFVLSMPNRGSWNGKWSGDGDLFARVSKLSQEKEAELDGKCFSYRWDDGWCARIETRKVDARDATKIRKRSRGFSGYDWMIQSIIDKGEIAYDRAED